MKLRIKGNSIRLRLTQSEVRKFERTGLLEEFIDFGSSRWRYAVRTVGDKFASAVPDMTGGIEVRLPVEWVRGWMKSDKVGFEATEGNGSKDGITILVEKDFTCLTARSGEDESDHFPNPLEQQGHQQHNSEESNS